MAAVIRALSGGPRDVQSALQSIDISGEEDSDEEANKMLGLENTSDSVSPDLPGVSEETLTSGHRQHDVSRLDGTFPRAVTDIHSSLGHQGLTSGNLVLLASSSESSSPEMSMLWRAD